MVAIVEDYVSFETAKLLKEKGFDEHCFCINYPLTEGEHHSIILPNLLNNSMIPSTDKYKFCRYKEDFITIPTIQMAMKWLREVHNINIDIVPICNQKRFEYQVFVITPENAKHCYIDDELYIGYEQACDVAIRYCLENLI